MEKGGQQIVVFLVGQSSEAWQVRSKNCWKRDFGHWNEPKFSRALTVDMWFKIDRLVPPFGFFLTTALVPCMYHMELTLGILWPRKRQSLLNMPLTFLVWLTEYTSTLSFVIFTLGLQKHIPMSAKRLSDTCWESRIDAVKSLRYHLVIFVKICIREERWQYQLPNSSNRSWTATVRFWTLL